MILEVFSNLNDSVKIRRDREFPDKIRKICSSELKVIRNCRVTATKLSRGGVSEQAQAGQQL